MDYFQGIVAEYLRANRGTFLNTEFFLQLDDSQTSPPKGSSWFVDIVAISFSEKTAFLCEVTYSKELSSLIARLKSWTMSWDGVLAALRRDTGLPPDWTIRPWLFVPEEAVHRLVTRMPALPVKPRVTPLEMTLPWRYHSWDRKGERPKPNSVPADLCN